jgi:hypothetical protein
MVSNETVLMCGEASVRNAHLCIHQSPQIINQLDGSILKKGAKYLSGQFFLFENYFFEIAESKYI